MSNIMAKNLLLGIQVHHSQPINVLPDDQAAIPIAIPIAVVSH